ncbi:MAG: PAS domain S-box protein [Candidatus Omnitrophica bacterium]|nr:PAS domain S-box protein [Candidatus Omnitrophota bacterium]MDE2008856.1 PAS domain S-box protein [Candidatus Omnitrophota bacterium]MDE2213581.1 PAS domain S-box protein [Candidatus Omnitrophota bacterium]MDE2230518.1 PAS domain S-box protein [Candidatus Omnitrophota bacterium]
MLKTQLNKLFLLESGKLLRQLIEESRAGVYMADEQGNLIYVNSAFSTILGYPFKGELIGKNLDNDLFVNPDEWVLLLNAMENKGFVSDYEVRSYRRDRSIAAVSITCNWIKDEANQAIGVEGIAHDITEKKKAEQKLMEEKEKLGQLMNLEEGLSTKLDLNQIGRFTVEQIARIFQVQVCSLMFYDEDKQELYIKAAHGLDDDVIKTTHLKIGEAVAGLIVQKRQPILVSNIDYEMQLHRASYHHYITRSFISSPIMHGARILGVINLTDKNTQETFLPIDLQMLCVASRIIGIAVENANRFKRLENLAFARFSLKGGI